MPITTTVKTLLESRDALRELSELSIPVRTALKARKIYKCVQSELETAQEQTRAIAEKHAARDADGKPLHPLIKRGADGEPDLRDENSIEIDKGKREAYQEDMDALFEAEVKIDFDKIKVADLSDPKDPPLKFKISTAFALDWLLED